MKKELSPELQREAERLAQLPDESIDVVDIPEASVEAWAAGRRHPGSRRKPMPANDPHSVRKAG